MQIVLEGISGAGKTSQARKLRSRLRRIASVEIVSEFSRGPIGRAIRRGYGLRRERFICFHEADRFADQTYLLLLGDTIAKAEEMSRSGADLVLVDRLFDSWLSYSLAAGNRRVLEDATIQEIHRACSREHVSGNTVTVFLELDVAVAVKRLAARDSFGFKDAEQHRLEEVARQFAKLYLDASIIRVDAGRSPLEVTEAILKSLELIA